MDEATLAGIEQRANAATEGPWHGPHDDGYGCVCIGDYGWVVAGPNYPSYDVDSEQGHADAEFIAHARTDLPEMAQALRDAWTRIEDLENFISELQEGR